MRIRFASVMAVVAVAGMGTIGLSSCIVSGPQPVTKLDEIGTAVVQIQVHGTYVEPGTLKSVEADIKGAGFFIGSDGLAITNSHLVTGATSLTVWIGGDQSVEYDATVLGTAECLDLAVIEVDGSDFPVLGWYDGDIPDDLDVHSAGFPLGEPELALVSGTASKGGAHHDAWTSLDHVIEHDARIRGGNSGGPLVTGNGRVVGVNYAGDDELDADFAIPRDDVLAVLDALKGGDSVHSLGLNPHATSPDPVGPKGIWVTSTEPGGIADEAGILPGDVITELAGVGLGESGTLEEYCGLLREHGVDATMGVTVHRPGDEGIYEGQLNGDQLALVGTAAEPVYPIDAFTTIFDESETLSVDVPDTWDQVAGGPFTDSTGTIWEALTASTDLASFAGTYNVPGVALQSTTALVGTDHDQALDAFTKGARSDCTLDESGDYDDGFYVGRFSYFTGCGGTDTDYLVLVADDVDGTHFMVVTVQLVSESDKTTVLDTVLNTFFAVY